MTAPIVYIDCSPLMRDLLADIGPGDRLIVHQGDPSQTRLGQLLSEATVVLNGHTHMNEALLAAARNVRSIVFLGTGASSYIDLDAAARLGIRIRVVRNYGDRAVAEHTFGLLLAAARQVTRMDRGIRSGTWSPIEGIELAGRTLGLVGLGGIGSEVARIAAVFGMKVLAWNRSGVPPGVPAEFVELDTLLRVSDAVSLHLALVAETIAFFEAKHLALMKPGVILVNTARGALIDEAALVAALMSGQIGHAALDVFATEPLAPTHPLALLDNVTLTAHAGWKTAAASRKLLEMALEIGLRDADQIGAGHLLD